MKNLLFLPRAPLSLAPLPIIITQVISLSTLRRLAGRDAPSPSPSKQSSSAAASSSAGRTRRSRPVPSPSKSSFSHGPSSLSSATASLCMPGEDRSVRSSRGGAKGEVVSSAACFRLGRDSRRGFEGFVVREPEGERGVGERIALGALLVSICMYKRGVFARTQQRQLWCSSCCLHLAH